MLPKPTILAFDTSAAHCAAALLKGGRIVASCHEEMKRGQAERLMPMLDEVMQEAGAVWEELDAVGVGIGPGNFTGIRISVSLARGLALSLQIPAIGISNFELLKKGEETQSISLTGPRDQVYTSAFMEGAWSEPKLVDPHRAGKDFTVPDGATIRGTDADIIAQFAAMDGGKEFKVSQQTIIAPASGIAILAAEKLATKGHTRPSPLYVRPADAAPPSDPPPVILP